jgi:hypothetical protein
MQFCSLRNRLAALLLVCIVIAGCTRAINRSAERRIRDALPQLVGPAKDYRVHVDNEPLQTVSGHLASVDIDGEDVQLSNGLLIDRLHLMLHNVDFDMRRHVVRGVGSASFDAAFGEAAVDEFLAGEAASEGTIRKPRVRFGNNHMVTLSAERVALGLGIPFSVTGPVEIDGPQHVNLDPHHMTVVGIPISGLPLRFLKEHFEHGLDLSSLPFPLELQAISTGPGKLTLAGSADVASVLLQAQLREP